MDLAHPAAQPAHGTGQRHVIATQLICRHFQSGRSLGGCHGVLNRAQQPGQPSGQEVRQQTERPMSLRAIPPRDADSLRHYAWVAAMACERTLIRRMQRASFEAQVAPLVVGNVGLGTRHGMQGDLHDPSLTFDDDVRRTENYVVFTLLGLLRERVPSGGLPQIKPYPR